jgi:uncharacterized protein (TIGR02246 family)
VTGADVPLLEELRIRRVLEKYCALLDAGDAEQLAELFTENCSFTMMGSTYQGRTAMAAVWSRLTKSDRPSTLHSLINPMMKVDGDTADAVTGWTMIQRSGEQGHPVVAMAGHYHDTLERGADAQWRFSSRRVQTLARPAG